MTFKTTVERETNIDGNDVFSEFEIGVEYDAHKACKGERDRFGVALEPDEEAHIEINEAAFDHNGNKVELTEQERERIEEEIWESLANE